MDQILLEGRQGVRKTEALDEARLGQIHEVSADPPEPVAPRAEGGNVAHGGDIVDHFVQSTVVSQGELGPRVLLGVTARVCAGSRGDL